MDPFIAACIFQVTSMDPFIAACIFQVTSMDPFIAACIFQVTSMDPACIFQVTPVLSIAVCTIAACFSACIFRSPQSGHLSIAACLVRSLLDLSQGGLMLTLLLMFLMPWECNTWSVLIALVCRLGHMAPQECLLSNRRPDLSVTGCPDSKE